MLFTVDQRAIDQLDITAFATVAQALTHDPLLHSRQLAFSFELERAEDDPRELSELDEVRLWFVRLDTVYPWLPYFLNWKTGELVRYAAMLVPHRFDRNEGIVFNNEALELFVFHKVFTVHDWLTARQLTNHADLRYMAQSLGYDIDSAFLGML